MPAVPERDPPPVPDALHADLPAGTLTMLFSDMEGSTRLLAQLGSRYAEVLTAQRSIQRQGFARHGGHEMGTEGDSFFVVFRSVSDAVAAAVEIQRRLAAEAWPDDAAVRVRMGLHTGEPERHDDGYVGLDVHRAARVALSAHGGQVVLSEATCRIASSLRAPGIGFWDLGSHRLKDLPGHERLYQLTAEGLGTDFPPLRTLGSGTTLPRPATSLVGRAGDVAAVRELLVTCPLVTLTGPAGTGKTRLALAVAAEADAHPDGVYFVPLASVTSADVLWTSVADALGVVGEAKAPPTFLEHLAPLRLLLVLDNLEQLGGAAEVIRELLGAGPGVRVLATSRRPVHLTGEREHPVAPLPVGPSGDDAVELFVRSAQLVHPSFRLTEDNAEDVREVCRSLDGLPLAIELVAARVKLLGPRALRARLDRALEVSTGSVDVPARQQSLRSALEWSHRLLTPDLQRTFRRLGGVDGEFDLDAAEAVTARGPALLDDLGELVDGNLLTVQEGVDGEPSFRMLRTIALFARDQLALSGEAEETRRRHAEHFLTRAETWCPRLRSAAHLTARGRIESDLENLRAALSWSLSPAGGAAAPQAGAAAPPERLAVGLRLCDQLSWFWYGCGYQAEGRRWLEAAVAAASGAQTPEAMAAVHGLGVLLLQHGEAERARDLLEAGVGYWRGAGDDAALSRDLNSLALAHRSLGEPEEATRLVEEAVEAARAAGHRQFEANAVSNLAALHLDAGRTAPAIELLERVLALDTELQDAWGQAADHVNMAAALLRAGRVDEAEEHLHRNARDGVALGDIDITVDLVGLFCAVHALRGDAERAARLLGASQAMRDQAELPLAPPDAAWLDGVLAAVRDLPDPGTWQRNVALGSGYGVEVALAEATGP